MKILTGSQGKWDVGQIRHGISTALVKDYYCLKKNVGQNCSTDR